MLLNNFMMNKDGSNLFSYIYMNSFNIFCAKMDTFQIPKELKKIKKAE